MQSHIFEYELICPYCGELVTMVLEGPDGSQQYIEDCEVCCNPIQIRFSIDDGDVLHFGAESIEQ